MNAVRFYLSSTSAPVGVQGTLSCMFSKKCHQTSIRLKKITKNKQSGGKVQDFKDGSRLHVFEFVFVKDGPEIKTGILRIR